MRDPVKEDSVSLDELDPRTAHGRHDHAPQTGFGKSEAEIVACGFLLIGAFFLLTEHWAHVLGVLPYLLILACPLMHLFMHKGHGGHGRHRHGSAKHTPDTGADT
jgi:hypothetical protein